MLGMKPNMSDVKKCQHTPLYFVSPLFLYALVQLYDIHIHIHLIHVLSCNVQSTLVICLVLKFI
jgi:hypothetical protein